MRVIDNDDGTYKVWMSDREYEQLRDGAETHARDLALRLGAEVGLRSHEIASVRPGHVSEEVVQVDPDRWDSGRKLAYFLEVPEGKDTDGSGGKRRDAFLPRDVERDLALFANSDDVDDDALLFDRTPRTIRKWVKDAAMNAAEETGDTDFQKVSSHDLRRYFATKCLQDWGMNPEVVMAVGGWEDYENLKPYLEDPRPSVIVEEFLEAGVQ